MASNVLDLNIPDTSQIVMIVAATLIGLALVYAIIKAIVDKACDCLCCVLKSPCRGCYYLCCAPRKKTPIDDGI